MKRITLVALIIVFSSVFIAGCGGRNASFGYVDMQKVFQESQKVKDLRAQMETKQTEIMGKMQEEEQANLSQEELAKKQQELSTEFMAFSQGIEKEFQTLFEKTVYEVAQEQKLGAVLTKENVLSGGVDITEAVIKKMQ